MIRVSRLSVFALAAALAVAPAFADGKKRPPPFRAPPIAPLQPPPPGIPNLRLFQGAQAVATLRWLRDVL